MAKSKNYCILVTVFLILCLTFFVLGAVNDPLQGGANAWEFAITQQPSAGNSYTVQDNGNEATTYQWYKKVGAEKEAIAGKTVATLGTVTESGEYFCEVSNGGSVCTSDSIKFFSVTFDKKNGEENAIFYVEENTTVENVDLLCTPTQDGYVFDGWHLENDVARTAVSEDTTLFAKWLKEIRFDEKAQEYDYNGSAQEFNIVFEDDFDFVNVNVAYTLDGTPVASPTEKGVYTVEISIPAQGEYASYSKVLNDAFAITKLTNKIGTFNVTSATCDGTIRKMISAVAGVERVTYSYSATRDGEFTSTKPTKAGTYFIKASIAGDETYKDSESVVEFAITHVAPGTPSYSWSGVETCQAECICAFCQETVVSETANGVIYSIKESTTTTSGKVVYVATFENEMFERQEIGKIFKKNGQTPTKLIENQETSLTVSVEMKNGTIDADVVAVVSENTLDKTNETIIGNIKKTVSKKSEWIADFDVYLANGKGRLGDIKDNKYKVTFAIPEELKNRKNYNILAVQADGTVTKCDVIVENDTISFETNTLEKYAVVADKQTQPLVIDDTEDETTEFNYYLLFIPLGVAVFVGLTILLIRGRRRKVETGSFDFIDEDF